jgi:hypothetical protein
MPDYEV